MALSTTYHVTEKQLKDEELCIKEALNNIAAFEPLYNFYYERVLGFVYMRVDSKDVAYDITADVFHKALENLKKYQFRGLPFSSWLFRIALNEIGTMYRKQKVRQTVSIESDGLPELYSEAFDSAQSPYGNEEETDKQLMNAIQTLDENEVQLVQMKYFEKMSFKEIAEVLELEEGAMKMKLYRALEKLKSKMILK